MRAIAAFALLLLILGSASAASVKWSTQVERTSTPSHLADGGPLLFVGSESGFLLALNKTNGRTEWQLELSAPVSSSPAVSSGFVYAATSDGTIYGIDINSRTAVWSYKLDGTIWHAAPVIYEDALYIGTETGRLYALNATDGRLIWRANAGGPIRSSVFADGGRIYVGAGDSRLYAFDSGNGRKIWDYKTGAPIWTSSPVVYLGSVYIGSVDGRLYKISAESGLLSETFETGGWVASTPLAPEGVGFIYSGSNDGNFYALDAFTLKPKWSIKTDGSVQATPIFSRTSSGGSIIFFGSNDQTLYAVRASSGSQLWNFSTSDWPESMSIDGNFVYFTTYDGKVYGISSLSCSIESPVETSKVSEESLALYGHALSNEGVGSVRVRINSGPWKTVTGREEWYANLSIENLQYGDFEVECMAVDSAGREETAPYSKYTYTKTEYVPPKEMQAGYPKQANLGDKITITLLADDGSPLSGAVVKLGTAEYVSNEKGIAQLAINQQGKYKLEISKDGYNKKTIEIEVKQEIGFMVYVYIGGAIVAIIAILFILRRRNKA